MDSVSIMLIVGLLVWGAIGIWVGTRTLSRQKESALNNQRYLYLLNAGNTRLQQAQTLRQQNQPLLMRPDLDLAVLVRILRQSIQILIDISDEAEQIAESPNDFPLESIQNLLVAFDLMSEFFDQAHTIYERRVGEEEMPKQFEDSSAKDAARAVNDDRKAADAKVTKARQRLAFA